MVEDFSIRIINDQDIRQSLIAFKNAIGEENVEIKNDELYEKLVSLLKDEDPKIRKNAAIILGSFKKASVKDVLLTGYKNEKIDFVKEGYLKGLSKQNCKSII